MRILERMIVSQRIPPSMIFSGPDDSGRLAAARAFAQALSCEKPSGIHPCEKCAACRASSFGQAFDVIDIGAIMDDEAEKNKTVALRRACAPHSRTHELKHFAAILTHAERMNDSMQATMLKTVEEPSPGVFYIFIVNSPRDLASTIRSRSITVPFPWVSRKTDDPFESFLLSPPQKGVKRAEILKKLKLVLPTAAEKNPQWREPLLDLDRAISSNAHIGLAFSVFRSRVKE